MSKGPGKWQRAVIEACEAAVDPATGFTRWLNVDRIASGEIESTLSRSEREAIRRAIRTLASTGSVVIEHGEVTRFGGDFYFGQPIIRTALWVRLPPSAAQIAHEAAEKAERMERRSERAERLARGVRP